uniref:Uncharacterized protein n=1 Tax=Poecilia formosa TaxID=48698 RepID=A0A087X449_POEFO
RGKMWKHTTQPLQCIVEGGPVIPWAFSSVVLGQGLLPGGAALLPSPTVLSPHHA